MSLARLTIPLAMAMGFLLIPLDSQAELLFKRIKCIDATSPSGNGLMVFHNQSSIAKYVTVRIVRDGCRPKGESGTFFSRYTDFYETTVGPAYSMTRMGKSTTASHRTVPAGNVLRIRFYTAPSNRIQGTFDLQVLLD